MLLITAEQYRHLAENGRRQEPVRGTDDEIDFEPVVKIFNPTGSGTWLLTEVDTSDDDVVWGLCDLGVGCPEFGTVRISELATFRGRLGLPLERDIHWRPRGPISAYIEAADAAGAIVDRLPAPSTTNTSPATNAELTAEITSRRSPATAHRRQK